MIRLSRESSPSSHSMNSRSIIGYQGRSSAPSGGGPGAYPPPPMSPPWPGAALASSGRSQESNVKCVYVDTGAGLSVLSDVFSDVQSAIDIIPSCLSTTYWLQVSARRFQADTRNHCVSSRCSPCRRYIYGIRSDRERRHGVPARGVSHLRVAADVADDEDSCSLSWLVFAPLQLDDEGPQNVLGGLEVPVEALGHAHVELEGRERVIALHELLDGIGEALEAPDIPSP